MRTLPPTGFLQVTGVHRRQSVPWRMLLLAFRRQGKAELRSWAALCSRRCGPWSAPARGRQSRRSKARRAVLHRSGRDSHPCFPFCCSAVRDKKKREGEQSKNKDFLPSSADLLLHCQGTMYYYSDIFRLVQTSEVILSTAWSSRVDSTLSNSLTAETQLY